MSKTWRYKPIFEIHYLPNRHEKCNFSTWNYLWVKQKLVVKQPRYIYQSETRISVAYETFSVIFNHCAYIWSKCSIWIPCNFCVIVVDEPILMQNIISLKINYYKICKKKSCINYVVLIEAKISNSIFKKQFS